MDLSIVKCFVFIAFTAHICKPPIHIYHILYFCIQVYRLYVILDIPFVRVKMTWLHVHLS